MTSIDKLYYMLLGRPDGKQVVELLSDILKDPNAKTLLTTPHIFSESLIVTLTLKNQVDAIKLLVDSGLYDVNALDPRSNVNALQYACLTGSVSIIDLLIDANISSLLKIDRNQGLYPSRSTVTHTIATVDDEHSREYEVKLK